MDCTIQSVSKIGWFVSNTENWEKTERKEESLRVTIHFFFFQNLGNENTFFFSTYNPGKLIFCEFSVGSLIVHYITMSTFQIVVKP